jgi:hypothetical protein
VVDVFGISLIFAVLLSSASAHAEVPDAGYWVADNEDKGDDNDEDSDDDESEWEKVEEGRPPVSKKRDQDWVKVESKPEGKEAESRDFVVKEEAVASAAPGKSSRKTIGYVVNGLSGLCLLRGVALQDRLKAGVVEGRLNSTEIADGKAETNLYITLGWVGLGAGAVIAFGPSIDGKQLALNWSGQW